MKKYRGLTGIFRDITLDFASHRIKRSLDDGHRLLAGIHQMTAMEYVDHLLERPRYNEPGRLQAFGFKACSQFDEDGIIGEILNRIGSTTRQFIEFGVGDGLENNTLYLLQQGWRGLWIESNDQHARFIRRKFQGAIQNGRLVFEQSMITRDNVNEIFSRNGFTDEIDVLSIDIDGNDYHIWESIDIVSPRVVVIEYNVKFRPPMEWVMQYDPKHMTDKTDHFGASLKSLELLGNRLGYRLVGCGLTGANAYFVRSDLVDDHFSAPFTAENHYEPCRYILAWQYRSGMNPGYGPFLGEGGKHFD